MGIEDKIRTVSEGIGAIAIGAIAFSSIPFLVAYQLYSIARDSLSERLNPVTRGCERLIGTGQERIIIDENGDRYIALPFRRQGRTRVKLMGRVKKEGTLYSSAVFLVPDANAFYAGIREGIEPVFASRKRYYDYELINPLELE